VCAKDSHDRRDVDFKNGSKELRQRMSRVVEK